MSGLGRPFQAASAACRHCSAPLSLVLADLGVSPIANNYVNGEDYACAEPIYPLEVLVCGICRLAQTRDVLSAGDVFGADYAYFSSHSTSWLAHAQSYVEAMAARFGVSAGTRHVELASNDGYLLQYSKARGARCLGVEPSQSVALAARQKGIETQIAFFGKNTARDLVADDWSADLITANNVLAHVPDINDFVGGVKLLLAPEGVATFEVQHLLKLMQRRQFDTIYHEHFSYLSLIAGERIFAAAGLRVFDVEELETHGGSIRFFVCHKDAKHATTANLARVRDDELNYGLSGDAIYQAWSEAIKENKRALLGLLIGLKRERKRIVGYGAPAKGVTLLNYCGIGRDFLDFTVDLAPSKQGRYLPGVRIPILSPEAVFEHKPDYLLILPWNIKAEIMSQMARVRDWGARFIVPAPTPAIED